MMTNKDLANQMLVEAFWQRSERHALDADVDNSRLHAGSPMFFRCEACHGQIILAEDFLTVPKLCYDCRELADRGLIFEMSPEGTGWNAK